MLGRCIALVLLALAACAGDPDPRGETPVASTAAGGPDPIVLRVARSGGPVRAYRYPRLDSLIWTSADPVTPPGDVLAFDQENGMLALVDRNGLPSWADLRIGRVTPSSRTRLAALASADAWSVYGVMRDTLVRRMTPSGEWSFTPGGPVAALFPQAGGDLVVMLTTDSGAKLLRVRPPEAAVSDSGVVASPSLTAISPVGDRLYFAVGRNLVIHDATFREVGRERFSGEITALALTPSGDRVYVAVSGAPGVEVLDRYSGERATPVALPGPARALRVDPLGRWLLARPDSGQGDSTWVISVGHGRLAATLATQWRQDLPTVAPEGAVVTVNGRNVEFRAPGQTRPRMIVREGANEFWHFVFWNGFRPRAKGLDQPVIFPQDDSGSYGFQSANRDSVPPTPALPRTEAPAPPPPAPTRDTQPAGGERNTSTGWTVSFAAMLSEPGARELARNITVDGQRARVLVTTTNGRNVYRVVLGPYATRRDAERAGRLSGRSYWVFEGLP
ncbi:MAG TPA: SPOR domain-containing protein [Gemmatimonadaceae bacterium]|nr:SPOR domain-containing protein [Gemmatimonadaceae bacterium]